MPRLLAIALSLSALAACGGGVVDVTEAAPPKASTADGDAALPEPPEVVAPDPAGATEHPDGLIVTIVEGGVGRRARVGDEVLVHYRAFLVGNDEPFDSSYARLVPDRLSLSTDGRQRAVSGLVRGLVGQREGTKARLDVPATLGWGTEGNEAVGVPADSDLVFDIHLVAVE